ncbi:unnamed protein product [Triticum turgidum subsp. durum]|uniref:FLZ-type domain-containing protein n=1 Tax=Triticum turgidum subsp. durum TaxID=4567 RepID=A0A9R0QS97_TRITD|nr:unnamed protein product [Triticum turgidum subsp. durum]
MMLRRVVSDQAAAGDALDGAAGGRPRGPAFFAVPRLLVGLAAAKRGTPDCDSTARSPKSPLEHRAFPALGGSLLGSPRSPRSWDSQRVGLGGLVDTLAEPAADAKNRLLGFQMRPTKLQCLAKSYTSLPKDMPKDCGHAQPELGEVEVAGAGGMSVPCTRFYGDVKSGPEVIVSSGAQLGFSNHSVDRAKFPASGSLPVSIGGPRRYIGSVSAMEVEQSEDYTCIIAHGSNPKTTRIFGDCILEPCPVLMPDWESKEIDVDKEGAELYWLVKGSPDADAAEESTRFCSSCKKNLNGNESSIYRGENAFCAGNCRNQAVLNEDEDEDEDEDEKNPALSSPSSASSTSQFDDDDIFIDGVVVLT